MKSSNYDFKINYYFNMLKEYPIYPKYKFKEYLYKLKLDNDAIRDLCSKVFTYQMNKYGRLRSIYDTKRKL